MPCFHTHWLVALRAIGNTPKYIKDGRKQYEVDVGTFEQALKNAIDARAFNPKQTRSEFRQALKDEAAKWKNGIQTSKEYDAITCFSAYMLGACGPDFWTVGSTSHFLRTFIPDTASEHFDLGHYNRTHHQFELSVAKVGGAERTDLKALVQQAYFLGMATHVAADLVVHQLVNISAGAYNLLEKWNYISPDKAWQNEDWTLGSLGKNLWNTHNKIEHYWDTYVRYRYLGDQGPFWPMGVGRPASESQSIPPPRPAKRGEGAVVGRSPHPNLVGPGHLGAEQAHGPRRQTGPQQQRYIDDKG